jgi:hypothetical protein
MVRFRAISVLLIAALGGSPADAQLSLGLARNLGDAINTPSIEVGPNLSADGLTLYFVSIGQVDIQAPPSCGSRRGRRPAIPGNRPSTSAFR